MGGHVNGAGNKSKYRVKDPVYGPIQVDSGGFKMYYGVSNN